MKKKLAFSEKEFSMPAWLYQMTTNENADRWWYPEEYRKDVGEGRTLTWPTGKIYFREQGQASKGDTVIFFFAKTGNNEPGIYGWGTIIDPPQETNDDITFVTKPPSDFLKDNPCWDDEVDKLLNDIRRGLYVGTMWNVTSGELNKLRKKNTSIYLQIIRFYHFIAKLIEKSIQSHTICSRRIDKSGVKYGQGFWICQSRPSRLSGFYICLEVTRAYCPQRLSGWQRPTWF